MTNYYWKMFEKSGKIHDYLHYACTSEDGLEKTIVCASDEGMNQHSSSRFVPPAAACREE